MACRRLNLSKGKLIASVGCWRRRLTACMISARRMMLRTTIETTTTAWCSVESTTTRSTLCSPNPLSAVASGQSPSLACSSAWSVMPPDTQMPNSRFQPHCPVQSRTQPTTRHVSSTGTTVSLPGLPTSTVVTIVTLTGSDDVVR